MARKSPYDVDLTPEMRRRLENLARSYSSPYFQVIRAKIILYAAEGYSNQQIADRLDTPRQIVSKWRKRYFEEGWPGLEERPRSGRPREFSPLGRGSRQGFSLRASSTAQAAAVQIQPFRDQAGGDPRRTGRYSGRHDSLEMAPRGRDSTLDVSQLDLPEGSRFCRKGRKDPGPL